MYEFTFANSKNISSETLFVFFSYITSSNEYPKNYCLRWYNSKEKKFHIPVTDIIKVLNKYFDGINFNPAEIEGYNNKTKTIDRIIDGFGGARFPKLSKKEVVSNNTLKITIDYYDPDYKKISYTNIYIIRYTDDEYKYLSIARNNINMW